MKKTNSEKLKEIEYQIVEVGATIEQLKEFRKQLYKINNCDLDNDEWTIKQNLLTHIKELIDDEKKDKVVFYEIYKKEYSDFSILLGFVESEKIAKAICQSNSGFFYVKEEVKYESN
jgi:hypothetical protein